jgi:hypothetical protein
MSRTTNVARIGCSAIGLLLVLAGSASASAEVVLLRKVTKEKVFIVRANGTVYAVDKGLGCLSLGQYEGRQIVVNSPGRFLGVGSRLVIPDVGQDCQVWKAEELKPSKNARDHPKSAK